MEEKEQKNFFTGKELADVLQLCGTLLQNLGLLETKRRKQLGYGKLQWVVGKNGKL